MTDISHFYGDDCEPPHEESSDGTKYVLAIGGREEEPVIYEGERDATIAMGEPVSLLERLRSLDREATPGEWSIENDAEYPSTTAWAIRGAAQSHFLAQVMSLSDAKLAALLRNLAPEIIEAFVLVEGLFRGDEVCSYISVHGHKIFGARIRELLSKVSETHGR